MRQASATGTAVDAYVTALPPAAVDQLPDHLARLRAAGASRLSLYHLGLAAHWRQPHLREMARTWAELG